MLLLGNMFLAQEKDTLQFQKSTFEYQYKKMYIPVGLMITGVIAGGHGENSWNNKIAATRNRDFPNFENHADDYLQFAPFVAAYGFELAGMKPKTDWKNRSAILIKGQILNLGLVYILKNTLKETRPDGTSLSFPSVIPQMLLQARLCFPSNTDKITNGFLMLLMEWLLQWEL